ncbi:ABC transporter permease subunit [candidate division KSB3 bacterium]|uniref:ABC transporter permease subunit n=1 Tax=candidate division KSB3 bacterium TaxID=2044937 RepID=A0A9D5JV93_9BACT|nr:ABC transporter permease subunit [candidate division KSB3 bacterium]MBD3324311.1 ABC transporter permease subunit [candidate division KSB3 bacterium]
MNAKTFKLVLLYIILIFITIAILFPIYWTFVVSTKQKVELLDRRPVLYPTRILKENYTRPFVKGIYGQYLANSIIISLGNVVLVLALAIPATYAFSRFNLKGEKHIFFWLITNRMAPPAAFLIPLYLIFSGKLFSFIQLIDTHIVLILTYCLFNLPFAIWLLRGTLDGIPVELDEAALVDGASHLGILWKIIIPLAKPTIAVAAVLVFLFSWNQMLLASILTGTRASTITPGIVKFATMAGTDWGEMAAVSIVCLLPAFLFLGFTQKYIITGMTFGAMKE